MGRCASDPPPPPQPTSSTGEAVTAQTPQKKCAGGVLTPGAHIITVHSGAGQLDIEFTGSLPIPISVDVNDLTTGQDGTGAALEDQKATYHFTEDQGTAYGDHTLSVNVDGVLGGPSGDENDNENQIQNEAPAEDEAPAEGDTIAGVLGVSGYIPPKEGDTVDGDVGWEVVSGGCIA